MAAHLIELRLCLAQDPSLLLTGPRVDNGLDAKAVQIIIRAMIGFSALINLLSAFAALAAAYFWYRASIVSVPPAPPSSESWQPASITTSNGGVTQDPFATATASSQLNARAAKFAAIAALLQGIGILLSLAYAC